nr:reverse transcriptase domain-containing protein [Tanacetum cinerariifolium]
MAEINKNLMRVLQVNQQVKAVTPNCKTCGGPHSFFDYPATIGNTQNDYAAGAYQCNSYQPQGNRNLLSYRSDNYLGPPGFNKNQNYNNQNHNFQNKNRNQGNHNPHGNNQGRNQFFQGANQGQNQPQAYQALAYQAPANDTILKNMQTNMTSLTYSNLELKNMFGQFMKINTASSSGSRTLTVNSPIIVPVASPVSAPRPNQRPSILHPSILQYHKLFDKANDQREKFFQIFKDLNFNISFVDALILMPKFGLSIKSLLTNRINSSSSIVRFRPVRVAEDVFVKVGTFHFPADFVVIDFDDDPRVPLILGRSYLKTERDLIDVFKGELTLRVAKEAITFNLDQTSKYSANYNDMTENRIDVINMACEEYSDFLLEEVDAFLALEDDPTLPKVDQTYVELEGDIILLEAVSPSFKNRPPMLNKENYVPWSSRLLRYAKSRPNGKLIHNSIINGPYIKRMISEPGDLNREVPVNETFHVQTDDELTEKELK